MCRKIVLVCFIFMLGLSSNVLADPNLVGWWKFDEGSGSTVADSSGNGYDGTISGAAWVSGVAGDALSFDGTNDYVDLPVEIINDNFTRFFQTDFLCILAIWRCDS